MASYGTAIIRLWLLTVQLSNYGFLRYSYHQTMASYGTVVKLGLLTVQLSSNQGFLLYSYHLTMASYGTVTIKLGLPTYRYHPFRLLTVGTDLIN